MTVGEKIRELRLARGWSQEYTGKLLGTTKQTIYKYETGAVTNIPLDRLEQIATIFDVSPSYLTGWNDSESQIPPGFDPIPTSRRVPMIGNIACGTPITAEQNVEGYVSVPDRWDATFTLTCHGDSMAPRIQDGDLVAIRKQETVENGQIAAVRIGDEATLKHVYLYPGRLILQPENPAYDPIVLIGDEIRTARIEGKAVGFCRGL